MAKVKPTAKRKAPKKLTKRVTQTEVYRVKSIEPPKPEPPKVEISVRNVYHDGQYLPALCFRNSLESIVPAISGDRMGIKLFSVSTHAHDKAAPVLHGPSGFQVAYPVERFLAHMNKLVSDGATITADALEAMRRLLHPFPVALPHALQAAADVAERLAVAIPRPVAENAPSEAVRKLPSGPRAVSGSKPNRTDGKQLIYELSRESGLPPEKVRAKLRLSGLSAPYTDPISCRKAMKVPDVPKKPRKKK